MSTPEKADKARQVKVRANEGGKGVVEIDGQDVSGLVRKVTVAAGANEPALVVLELGRVVVHTEASAQVEVDKPTADFLRTLGWTPPAAG